MIEMTEDFKENCQRLREALLPFEADFKALNTTAPDAMPNVMLAFRHLEDCRMRLGKAIQAYDGGTSVYPR